MYEHNIYTPYCRGRTRRVVGLSRFVTSHKVTLYVEERASEIRAFENWATLKVRFVCKVILFANIRIDDQQRQKIVNKKREESQCVVKNGRFLQFIH